MKKPNITPGEWKLSLSGKWDIISNKSTSPICRLETRSLQCESNAQFIAASKDMADALVDLLSTNRGDTDYFKKMTAAKSALIKAGYKFD